jgi:acetyl-CoA acetyltransferase
MRPLNAAVVGAAITPVGVFPEETSFGLAARALAAALDDAGLDRSDVDGFVWNLGRPSGEDYDVMLEALGLQARFVTQFWTHGRFTGSSLAVAAMAVTAGLADVVVCVGGTKRQRTPATPPPAAGIPAGDERLHGMASFVHHGALALQRYLALYGVDGARLADVVLAARDHALLNETAYLRQPLTLEEYLDAPYVVEPLRGLDCFPLGPDGGPMNDYGACVLVARGDAAASLGQPVAYILGAQGVQGGREEVYFGRPGLGLYGQSSSVFQPSDWDLRIYDHAGIGPAEVDAFYTYDAFSSLVWMALERFGHCAPGEAPAWATRERIGPHGSFPVNTSGGLLSQGHTAGWGHVVELTQQLRGRAGARQLEGIYIAQWASVFGDAVVLTGDEDRWRR